MEQTRSSLRGGLCGARACRLPGGFGRLALCQPPNPLRFMPRQLVCWNCHSDDACVSSEARQGANIEIYRYILEYMIPGRVSLEAEIRLAQLLVSIFGL